MTRMFVRKKAILYAAITLLLPFVLGFAVGQVTHGFSVEVARTVIEVRPQDVLERSLAFPKFVESQLKQVPVFDQSEYARLFLTILTHNAMFISVLILAPLSDVLDEYIYLRSKRYRKLSKIVLPNTLNNFPHRTFALLIGTNTGALNGWMASSYPTWLVSAAFILAMELFIFILGLAFLYDFHLQPKPLTSQTILTIYKGRKTYFAIIYLLLVISALIETNVIEAIIEAV